MNAGDEISCLLPDFQGNNAEGAGTPAPPVSTAELLVFIGMLSSSLELPEVATGLVSLAFLFSPFPAPRTSAGLLISVELSEPDILALVLATG